MKPGIRFTCHSEDGAGNLVRKARIWIPSDVNASELLEAFQDFMRACGYHEETIKKISGEALGEE